MLSKRITSLVIVITCLSLIFCPPLQANEAFDEFAEAIVNKATKIRMQELCKKYAGARIEGRAYIISISEDNEGSFIVNLSTKKDAASSRSIHIVVFLRKYFIGKKLKAKAGSYVRFMGKLKEFRMSTIILDEGVVKY